MSTSRWYQRWTVQTVVTADTEKRQISADNSEKSLVCVSSEETLALFLNVNMVLIIIIF